MYSLEGREAKQSGNIKMSLYTNFLLHFLLKYVFVWEAISSTHAHLYLITFPNTFPNTHLVLRFSTSVLGVWKCDEKLMRVFDILLYINLSFWLFWLTPDFLLPEKLEWRYDQLEKKIWVLCVVMNKKIVYYCTSIYYCFVFRTLTSCLSSYQNTSKWIYKRWNFLLRVGIGEQLSLKVSQNEWHTM